MQDQPETGGWNTPSGLKGSFENEASDGFVWERRQPPTSLRTVGLKGESHARLNFRPDQKECDLGLGRQQSLSAQQRGFGGEDPKHQIASAFLKFSSKLLGLLAMGSLSTNVILCVRETDIICDSGDTDEHSDTREKSAELNINPAT
ncbi:hypothetical protein EYF80_009521 [Scomber scombrus]|uniref:Uncharacterized protein n=1 Tax=Scomber scombrus TaxID=13677 RepID=A0AAV1NBQ2_SCOSC